MLIKKIGSTLLALLFIISLTSCGSGGGGGVISSPGGATLQSISVAPADPSVAVNTAQQFTATGIYSDNSTKDMTDIVDWSTSDASVAIVSSATGSAGTSVSAAVKQVTSTPGQAYAAGVGTATITATWGKWRGWGRLHVSQATLSSIAITPHNPNIAKGTNEQFTATGTFSDNTTQDVTKTVTWSSSNGAATISNAVGSNGLVTAAAAGSTTITATSGSVSGSTNLTINSATLVSIAVTPSNPGIASGTSQQFTATGTYSDNSTQNLTNAVTWNSSSTNVATITTSGTALGLATSLSPGTTTITATLGSVSGSTGLTVNTAALVSITVTPANPAIANSTKQQFTALGTYSDNSTQDLTNTAAWSSSNTGVASISNASGSKGVATSTAAGSTTITAASGSVSGNTTLTVNPATLVSLSITPANPAIAKGTSQQFTATGTYSDNTTQNLTASVTWSSSNTGAAAISNASGSKGKATSTAAGSTTITAVSGNISATTSLTINPAYLVSITVTPATPGIANGASQQFTATGTYSDNTTQNLTTAVTWNSSNMSVATISNAAGSNGLASSAAAGTTTITAASGNISGTASLTVTTSGSATLSWSDPTTNNDGTSLTDLAYIKIYYGTQSGVYTTTINAGTATTYTVNNLASGTYYFAVTAVNSSGVESIYSNEVSKTIP